MLSTLEHPGLLACAGEHPRQPRAQGRGPTPAHRGRDLRRRPRARERRPRRLRPLADGPCQGRVRRHRRGPRRARRRRRAHRRRQRPLRPASRGRRPRGDVAADAAPLRGVLRGPGCRRRRRRAPRPGGGRRRAGRRRLRPAACGCRPGGRRCRPTPCPLRGGHQSGRRVHRRRSRDSARRMRGGRRAPDREQQGGRVPTGDAGGRSDLGGGRAADVLDLDAGSPRGARRSRRDPRRRPRPDPGHRSRRRRRIRQQGGCHPRGGPRRLGGAPGGPDAALDGVANRGDGRDRARARSGADGCRGRPPRRTDRGLPAGDPPGRRRLSPHRRAAPSPDRDDGRRGVRHPPHRGARPHGHHDHRPGHRLPRCRPSRGDRRHRARRRPLRGRDRHGPCRGAAAQRHLARCLPVRDQDRRGLRLGRLRDRAEPRSRGGRVRGAAGGAGTAQGRG